MWHAVKRFLERRSARPDQGPPTPGSPVRTRSSSSVLCAHLGKIDNVTTPCPSKDFVAMRYTRSSAVLVPSWYPDVPINLLASCGATLLPCLATAWRCGPHSCQIMPLAGIGGQMSDPGWAAWHTLFPRVFAGDNTPYYVAISSPGSGK